MFIQLFLKCKLLSRCTFPEMLGEIRGSEHLKPLDKSWQIAFLMSCHEYVLEENSKQLNQKEILSSQI